MSTQAPAASGSLLAGRRVALSIPRGVRLQVPDDDFFALCRANPDLRLERTAQGDLIVMAPAGSESGGRNAVLTTRLGVWTEADGTGVSFDSSAGFKFPNGATRSPDASWIRKERWEALTPKERRGFAPICPDFAVELCSPSDEPGDTSKKMQEYIDNGLRLGWLIDPDHGRVEIYRPGRPVEVLDRPVTLSGEDVLPGFTLDLKGVLFR
jgi:Uma2 family endonuclease